MSGSNLALLLVVSGALAVRLGVRGWWLRATSLATAVFFVLLCRGEPSVIRAAGMGLVMVAALGSGARDGRGMRHLAVACLGLLLWDPWLSRSVGFALSVLASAGIIVWGRRWATALAWAPIWVGEAIAVPLAAQLATQPVVTAISGQVTAVGLVANAVAGPLVGPATVAGVVATLLGWCPPLATAAAFVAGVLATGIVVIARAGAALPGASWSWPVQPTAMSILVAACLLAAWLAPRVLARPIASLGVGLGLVACCLHAPVQPEWPPRAWSVVACDVGQGDAVVVDAGGHSAIVVDTGPAADPLERCLASLGVETIGLLVLSHDHADHVGGLTAALRRPVGRVMLSRSPSSNRAVLRRTLGAAGVTEIPAEAGMTLTVGEAHVEVLAAPEGSVRVAMHEGESSAENDGSLLLRVRSRGVATLLTGDVEPTGQTEALASGADLAVDVLKVPHHGSGRQDGGFLQATHATVALIGVGADNDYRHPAPKTVAALRSLGMAVARTDLHGGVAVARDGDRLVVVTQRSTLAKGTP